jgi:hypothetical protein
MDKITWAFLSIASGFVTMTVLIGTAALVMKRTVPEWVQDPSKPNRRYQLVNLGCNMAAAIFGGYLTAWIARENALIHTLALALTVLLISALSVIQLRKKQPILYQLLMIAFTPVAVIAGGLLRLRTLGIY